MLHQLIDSVTLIRARYVRGELPSSWRLNRVPGAHLLFATMPTKLLDATVAQISRLTSHSEVFQSLNEKLAGLRVAQIGGVTRSMFDGAGNVVRFNTHDWRSADDGSQGGTYIAVSGLKLPTEDNWFDVLASRHVLEHIANPIASLLEWKRVLKGGGYLYISVPDRRKTVEHRRALTPIDHFIADYEAGTPEFDLTHEEEIRQAGCGIIQHDRYENPYVHYHTFEDRNLRGLLDYCGFEVVELTARDLAEFRYQLWDLTLLARKPQGATVN